jgi:scavenger receptor class B protein 1
VELYIDIYLFNWTNSEQFVYPDFEKPVLVEHGPYRFREVRDKVNIKFNDDNSTVSYRLLNNYVFDEEDSRGSLDDVITNINMVAIGAAEQSKTYDYQMTKLVSMVLKGYYEDDIFVSKTVRELLFEGYEDDMITMGRTESIAGIDMSAIPYDRAGWFYLVS